MHKFKDTLKPVRTVLEDAKMKKSDIDEIVLVGGSTRIPIVQKLLSDFFEGKKLNKDINPDEAVAYGAAVQAFILSGKTDDETKDMLLIDLISLSLGIETVGGVHSKVITKNTHMPTSKSQTFTTNENDQTTVTISVYQGEANMVKNNKMLGKFDLTGIDKAPRGVPQIEVSFDVDANGILVVTAKDKSSGKNSKIEINNAMADSSEDLKEMMENFKKYEEEDQRSYNRTLAKNKLISLLHQVEDYKTKEAKKISKEDSQDLENLIKETKTWVEGANINDTEAEEFEEKAKEVSEFLKEVQTGESKDDGDDNEEEDEEEEDNEEDSKGSEGSKGSEDSKGSKGSKGSEGSKKEL